MDVAQPCYICKTVSGCDCKKSCIRYLELFIQADERCRISSPNDTSYDYDIAIKSTGIDKLNFQVLNPSDELIKRIIKVPVTTTKRGLWIHQLHAGITVQQRHIKQPYFITNPNKFDCLKEYFTVLKSIIGDSPFNKTSIKRLDLNLDLNHSFQKVLQLVDVKDKRMQFEFVQNSAVTNALRIGKGDEKIQIYDKGFEQNVDEPWSRIEIQLKGKKLPFKNLKEIETSFYNIISKCNILENIKFISAIIKDAHLLPNSYGEKIAVAREYLKNEGFFKMRKALNRNGNFHRDFNKLMSIKHFTKQPKDLYLTNVRRFLGLSDQENS